MTSAAISPAGTLRLGAVYARRDPAWSAFFPAELPEDWRPAYYAHQWGHWLLPAEDWDYWVGRVRAGEALCAQLHWFFRVPDAGKNVLADMQCLVEGLGGDPVYFLGSATGHHLPLLAPLRPHGAGASGIWPFPRRWVAGFADADRVVVEIAGLETTNLRRLRAELAEDVAALPQRAERFLFLQAGPQTLENARIIARLSGWMG